MTTEEPTPRFDPESRATGQPYDHCTRDAFFQYYADQSLTALTAERFARMRDIVLRVLDRPGATLDVADVGCNTGTQSRLWAALGHRVHGLDVSEQFIAVARERTPPELQVDFRLGSATQLPWANESMDVCLAIELLEHVVEWERCLDEFTRILRPGGALFLTTTNVLCPVQQEFDLPLYSWYPKALKRHYERLVATTRPELAGYATYPAVNWFSFFGLRRELRKRGCRALDRFDVIDESEKSPRKRLALSVIRAFPQARFAAHVVTPSTWVLAVKE